MKYIKCAFGVLLCISLLASSCQKERGILTTKAIKISVSVQSGQNATKSNDLIYKGSFAVPGPDGAEPLYIHEYESALADPDFSIYESKAAISTTSSLNVSGQSFLLNAYLKGTPEGASEHYMDNVTVTRAASSWTLPGEYYWYYDVPVDFWALYPADAFDSFEITDGASVVSPSMSFSYSLESITDGTAAQSMQDMLVAYRRASGETVKLEFTHALSGIVFKNKMTNAEVSLSSVVLQGVHKGGTCTFDGSEVVWSDLEDGATYVQNYTSASDLENADKALFVVPQPIEDGRSLVMSITSDGATQERTVYIPDKEWKAGRKYTYELTNSEKPSMIYVIEKVEDGERPFWSFEYEDYAEFESFSMDPLNPSVKTHLPSEAWISFDGGLNWISPEEIEDLLENEALSDEVWGAFMVDDDEISTLSLTMNFLESDRTNDPAAISAHASTLASRAVKGSVAAPFDLSAHDVFGNLRGKTVTANCYVVGAPGCYVLPLVYGNAIDFVKADDGLNTKAYTFAAGEKILDHLVNVNGTAIASPYIQTDLGYDLSELSACVVWQDVPSGSEIVKNVTLVSSASVSSTALPCDYLRFSISASDIRQGNAVLAVRHGNDILWSWHIWVTDEDIHPVDVPDGAIMPSFLGWTSDGPSSYHSSSDRSMLVKLRQYEDGASGKAYTGAEHIFRFAQKAAEFEFTHPTGSAPYYQGGRKDPFLPCVGGYNFHNKSWTSSGYEIAEDEYRIKNVLMSTSADIASTIANPYKMYYRVNSKDEYFDWNGSYANLWGASNGIQSRVKSIYDPTPAGFIMPSDGLFDFMCYQETKGKLSYLNSRFAYEYIDSEEYTPMDFATLAGGWPFYTQSMPAEKVWKTSSPEVFLPLTFTRKLETVSPGTIGKVNPFSETISMYAQYEWGEGHRCWLYDIHGEAGGSHHSRGILGPVVPQQDLERDYFSVSSVQGWEEDEYNIDFPIK